MRRIIGLAMSDPTQVFWRDLAKDLEDPEFLRNYIVESVRIGAIDKVMNQIEAARETAGLSKADLARAVNAKPDSVRRLLSSRNANPTLGTLAELAAALGYAVTLTPLSEADREAISIPLLTGASSETDAVAKRFRPVPLSA